MRSETAKASSCTNARLRGPGQAGDVSEALFVGVQVWSMSTREVTLLRDQSKIICERNTVEFLKCTNIITFTRWGINFW